MQEERGYLNVLKGLLIVLVVIGHFGQTIVNNLPINIAFVGQGIILFIYSFHMPLFLFVSGYLSKNVEKRRRKAFENLFIPYLLFQLVVGICSLVLTQSWSALQNIFIPQMGAWYLLTLFSYRMILPEVRRIRGILPLGIIFTIFSCFTGAGNEFALRKSLGFFIYFMAGYSIGELPRKKINKNVARTLLIGILIILMVVSWRTGWYSTAFSVLCRDVDTDTFSRWYMAPISYLLAFVTTSIVMILIMNAIPDRSNWFEKQGIDTLPIYLSHLILFMAIRTVLNNFTWTITVGISLLGIVLSITLFSATWYRNVVNIVIERIIKFIFREED